MDPLELGLHSRAKDWLLKAWLDVCVKVHKDKPRGRRIVLVDLYAGDGKNAATLPDGTRDTWPGSTVRMAEAALQDSSGRTKVVANEAKPKNHALLVKELEPYKSVLLNPPFREDARTALPRILTLLDPRDHNFFFVDPFSHSEVDLDLLRRIGLFGARDIYGTKWFTRRPEILFTFMTSGLQLSMSKQALPSIDGFFRGFDWRRSADRAMQGNLPVYEGFVAALAESMFDLYDSMPQFEVRGETGNILYFLVFWATHPLAKRIYPDVQKYAYRYRDESVIKKWVAIERRVRALGRTGKTLDDPHWQASR